MEKLIKADYCGMSAFLRKKKTNLKKKNLGPKITITIENWAGVKKQTIIGFPNSVSINNRPDVIYRLGDMIPHSISQPQTHLSVEMHYTEIKRE